MFTQASPIASTDAVLGGPFTVPAEAAHKSEAEVAAEHAEALQHHGKSMILAGFIITILGVVAYCGVCFAGSIDAELGDMLLNNTVPFARLTLGVLGLGTLVWLVGSFTYLRGVMDAEDESGRA